MVDCGGSSRGNSRGRDGFRGERRDHGGVQGGRGRGGFRDDRGGGFHGDHGGGFRGDRGGRAQGGRGAFQVVKYYGWDISPAGRSGHEAGGQPVKDLARALAATSPEVKHLIQLLLKQKPFTGVTCASDWAQTLISAKKIELGANRKDFDIELYPEDGEALPSKLKTSEKPKERDTARKCNTFKLLVQQVGTLSLAELTKDISNASVTCSSKLEAIQALNIIMSYGPSMDEKITVANRNKFYPFQTHPQFRSYDLGGGLQALRGYFSSVRTSISRILVNVNVATGSFYKPGPLLDLMRELGPPPRNEFEFERLNRSVRKLRVETNYFPQSRRKVTKPQIRTICNLSPFNTNAQNLKFTWIGPDKSTKDISVEEHFMKTYKIKLKVPQAPLINYGTTKEPKWIPVELCSVLPGQLARRILQPDQTRSMIEFAARRPHQNADSIIKDGVQVTKIAPIADGLNLHLKEFGIRVDANLLTVPGRILRPPVLSYKSKDLTSTNGKWNLDARSVGPKPFRIAESLPSWNCLIIESGQRPTIAGGLEKIRTLLENFRQQLEVCGVSARPVQEPAFLRVDSSNLHPRAIETLQQQITEALRAFPKKPQLLFVVLPSDNALLYDCIKFVCDVENGIPNICCIGSRFSKETGQVQYFSNLALKFNQKLGGVNHLLKGDSLDPLDSQTIVFGIDITHPSPGSAISAPSIVGIVASVDSNFSQFPASIRTQQGRKEMVQELDKIVLERLRVWQKKNGGKLPTKVIIYRDGVSEGQYRLVMEEEYPSILAAFKTLYGAGRRHPTVSIIVVGKRHHTRFYPTRAEDADQKTGNPQPGTVVDRGITNETLFDFFLLPHQGLQGTSKPPHYVVIKDDNKLGADQLQILTYNLSHTFARATRSVSVCPPAYYADLVCERGRCYLHDVFKGDGSAVFDYKSWKRDVHPALAESMFYL